MAQYNVIEIDSRRAALVMRAMVPGLQKYDYDELQDNFVVIDYPQDGTVTLMSPEELFAESAVLEADGFRLKVLRLDK
jgi:hypothetical protein